MFAPDPLRGTGWYAVPGTLANGTTVDVARGGPVTAGRPPELSEDLAAQYPNQRWRKYTSNLLESGYGAERWLFLEYHCQRWNRTHGVGLLSDRVRVRQAPDDQDRDGPPGDAQLRDGLPGNDSARGPPVWHLNHRCGA